MRLEALYKKNWIGFFYTLKFLEFYPQIVQKTKEIIILECKIAKFSPAAAQNSPNSLKYTYLSQKMPPEGRRFFPALFISKLDIYLSNFSTICERASFLPQIWGRENILQFRMPLPTPLVELRFQVVELDFVT